MSSKSAEAKDGGSSSAGLSSYYLMPTKKKCRLFLWSLDQISKRKDLPPEIKLRIIRYAPSIIYSPQLLKKTLLFVESKTLPVFCGSLIYDVMKDYLRLYENNDDTSQIIQHEIDYRDTYYAENYCYSYAPRHNSTSLLSYKKITASKKSRKKHCCQIN